MENDITNKEVEYIVAAVKKQVAESTEAVKTDVSNKIDANDAKINELSDTIKSLKARFGTVDRLGSEEKFVKFKKAVALLEVIRDVSSGREISSEAKALGFDLNSGNGGVLLPCEMWDGIMMSQQCSQSLMSFVKRLRGNYGGGISMRSLLGLPSVGFVGQCGKASCTDVAFGKTPKLSYEKIFAILPVCNDLLVSQRDPGAIEGIITDAMAEAVSAFWDDVIMNADGTAGYGNFYGIVNATDANGFNNSNGYLGSMFEVVVNSDTTPSTTIQTITRDDIINLITANCCTTNGKLYMSCQTFALIMKLKDGENRPLFDNISLTNRNILGYEVVLTDTLPTPDYATPANDSGKVFIVFGDLSTSVAIVESDSIEIGTKQDVAYECGGNMSSSFSNDESVFYIKQRAMLVITNPEKLSVLMTA